MAKKKGGMRKGGKGKKAWESAGPDPHFKHYKGPGKHEKAYKQLQAWAVHKYNPGGDKKWHSMHGGCYCGEPSIVRCSECGEAGACSVECYDGGSQHAGDCSHYRGSEED
jgi:hypothetical protein